MSNNYSYRDNYMRFAADLIWMWIALSQLYLGVDSDVGRCLQFYLHETLPSCICEYMSRTIYFSAIVVFHQPPVLYALPGDNITLLCVTQSQTNHEGYWQINGLIANANRRSTLQDKGIVYSQYTTNNDSILLTHLSLSIVAYPNNNKTNISCEVYRDHSKSIFIIVGKNHYYSYSNIDFCSCHVYIIAILVLASIQLVIYTPCTHSYIVIYIYSMHAHAHS